MPGDVFVVPVLDRWLVHAPLHRVTALVNRAAIAKLKGDRPWPKSGRLADLHATLAADPWDAPRPNEGVPCPEFLGLIPTRACNLSCVYCGFGVSESGPEAMSFDLAVAAIDWMAEHVLDAGRSMLELHFFGGKPFSAPDVVDVAPHRARARVADAGLTPRFEVAGLQPPDPWEFATRCVRASALASHLGVAPVYAAASVDAVRHSFCPIGRDTLLVSPDGRVSTCYLPEQEWTKRGLDLNLGRLEGTGKIHLDPVAIERVRGLTGNRPRCQRCLARWHCAGGCQVNHSYPGCPGTYDAFCIQTRIITAYRLLEELGCREEVERLLDDRPALERLALRTSDRLTEWEEQDG